MTDEVSPLLGARPGSILERDVDVVAAQLDAMGRHGLEGGEGERLAGPDVEPRPVTRAPDHRALELAFGQGAPVVGADIVDGVEASVDVEDGDRPPIHL